ncbi:MAG: hypothetical protein ABIT37_04990 [Luteolibacter sp.]
MHPADPKTIWVSSTVWNGDEEGGFEKTTDGGVTWKEMRENPVNPVPYLTFPSCYQ